MKLTLEQMRRANEEICMNCGIRIERGNGFCGDCWHGKKA